MADSDCSSGTDRTGDGSSPLDALTQVLRWHPLAGLGTLVAALFVGVALGQLVGSVRVGDAATVLPALVVAVAGVAVVLAVGLRAARSTNTPYW